MPLDAAAGAAWKSASEDHADALARLIHLLLGQTKLGEDGFAGQQTDAKAHGNGAYHSHASVDGRSGRAEQLGYGCWSQSGSGVDLDLRLIAAAPEQPPALVPSSGSLAQPKPAVLITTPKCLMKTRRKRSSARAAKGRWRSSGYGQSPQGFPNIAATNASTASKPKHTSTKNGRAPTCPGGGGPATFPRTKPRTLPRSRTGTATIHSLFARSFDRIRRYPLQVHSTRRRSIAALPDRSRPLFARWRSSDGVFRLSSRSGRGVSAARQISKRSGREKRPLRVGGDLRDGRGRPRRPTSSRVNHQEDFVRRGVWRRELPRCHSVATWATAP
jgi:hypothetical protein